jgi:endonuclease/exonuclease/phosphatase family metal-dependent hydrolase
LTARSPLGNIVVLHKRTIVCAFVLFAGCTGTAAMVGTPSGGNDPAPPPTTDPPAPPPPRPDPPAPGMALRNVAANITTGTQQAYEDPGIRILQGLHPDIALLQELNYQSDSDADLRAFVDQAFGPDFTYARQSGVEIANGVVSRFPILDSGVWRDPQSPNRDFVWAHIDLPGPTDLYAVSVHLLTRDATTRDAEAQTLVGDVLALPADAYVIIGGDFNTDSRGEPCIATLAQVTVTDAPYPVDGQGNANTNASRSKPYDWLLSNPALQALASPLLLDDNTFDDGLVADTRVYAPLSDLAPALADDSGATNMQHMAVMRAFTLP